MARFIDASIYRNTFPVIRIAILFFIITISMYTDFHLGRKDTVNDLISEHILISGHPHLLFYFYIFLY